jgi:8-oxo-dGTP diphosphatase
MENENRPKVGVGVFILKDGKVLMGLRKGTHGPGTWCPPGGHLEYAESPEECAKRETDEECGLNITNVKRGPYTNAVFQESGKHYITLYMIADWKSGEPQLLEPDKCEKWDWFAWDELPEPIFLPIKELFKQNFNPFK